MACAQTFSNGILALCTAAESTIQQHSPSPNLGLPFFGQKRFNNSSSTPPKPNLGLESCFLDAKGVVSCRQASQMILTRRVRNGSPLPSRALVRDGNLRSGNNRATRVGNGAENSRKLGLGAKIASKGSEIYNREYGQPREGSDEVSAAGPFLRQGKH